ncbi:rhodopsin, GQ-coupled-like [Asterias amurensis]|uniref:rhodopsin, GQ-coupled-like n=1 Tax=Asterias amurensis TaxID=7602 RepID=UPI003AB2B272
MGGSVPSEHIVLTIFYYLIGLLGILGNTLVIYVVVRAPSLRSVTNVLICNQAVIDLTSSLVFVVIYLLPTPAVPESQLAASVYCKLYLSHWLLWGTSVSSTANLVLLTIERYIAVFHPIKYRNKFTRRRAQCLAVIPWFIGPLHELGWALVHRIDLAGDCTSDWPSQSLQMGLGILFFSGHYVIPVTLMIYVYTRIVMKLRRDMGPSIPPAPSANHAAKTSNLLARSDKPNPKKPGHLAKSTKRSTLASRSVLRTLVIVSVTYIICWGPNEIIYLFYNLGGYVDFNGVYSNMSVVFALGNMCLNPIIYAFNYRELNNALMKLFPCTCKIRWERFTCWRKKSKYELRGKSPTVATIMPSSFQSTEQLTRL